MHVTVMASDVEPFFSVSLREVLLNLYCIESMENLDTALEFTNNNGYICSGPFCRVEMRSGKTWYVNGLKEELVKRGT